MPILCPVTAGKKPSRTPFKPLYFRTIVQTPLIKLQITAEVFK